MLRFSLGITRGEALMKSIICLAVVGILVVCPLRAAAPSIAYDGQTVSMTAENQTFGQVMNLIQQKTGVQYEIPNELQSTRLPLVEIKNLSMKDALLKVLEGSNYDYILVAEPGQPSRIQRLLVTGKSSKVVFAASAFRGPRVNEDPFGGAVENIEENNNVQSAPEAPMNTAPPAQNPPQPQGLFPFQPGVAPVPGNPNQPIPQNGVVQQPQGLQPFNPFANQNNRPSPY